ncbi:MAG: aquaporin, partial [Acholeplasmatales bacterium]|nr:aquaporin [Acholeplasmatales bacterium]
VGIGLTGTSVNPARSIATAFADLIYSGKATALSQVWIFILAPLAGGALAALVYKLLHKDDADDAAEAKTEETEEVKDAE